VIIGIRSTGPSQEIKFVSFAGWAIPSQNNGQLAANATWQYSIEDGQHIWRTCWGGENFQVTVVPRLENDPCFGPTSDPIPPTVSLHRVLPNGSLERIRHHDCESLEEAWQFAEEIRGEDLVVQVMLAKL
jgi:hypothetical protein